MRWVLGALMLCLLAGKVSAETLLRLSETAEVPAHPDELAASMRSEAQSPVARQAQATVNAAMAKALAALRAASGVTGGTSFYQVFQAQQPSPHWQAAQGLAFAGADGEAVLGLVAALQAEGLVLDNLTWRLRPETARKAHEAATEAALLALRARAEAAAKVLGMKLIGFREIRLDGTAGLRPAPRLAGVTMAMAAPVAQAADQDVSATVEADAVLQ